jgi:diguanylate cyclase (GGDEF)-like protein/PAS domain S-box-containing protein
VSKSLRVLIVEDSESDSVLLQRELRRAGYDIAYDRVDTAPAMREALGRCEWDVVLSDYSMPGFGALEALEILHESGLDLPFIIVSGAVGEDTAVAAMRAGAHDYIMKGNLARLPPAIERELREVAVRRQRRRAELALRESEERYALVLRGVNDGLWDWKLPENTVYFSARWKRMLGYEEDEIGSDPDEWLKRVHPEDLQRVKRELRAHLEGGAPHFESEHRVRHKDGAYCWVLVRGLAVRDATGAPERMVGSQSDITRRKTAEQQLLHDAFHDSLTGLANRALFMDRLAQALMRARRRSEQRCAVVFLDLDRFKVVNDSLGHAMGDQLLVAIAGRLRASLRPEDTVARLGGDEFCVLLDGIRDVSAARRVAERIQRALETPFSLDGHEVFATASMGIALSVPGVTRAADLVRDADTAMYRAKTLGRGRYEVFDATMRSRALEQWELETDLRRAMERGEFSLWYQPIVSLETGALKGLETLVRWHHPKRGLLNPSEFIGMAEETGLIVPIGRWVLREACARMCAWTRRLPDAPRVSIGVNMSARQLAQPRLLDEMADVLGETGLDRAQLVLEITESVIMENAGWTTALLSDLRSLGIQLYIDDFGTGYSSLSYLSRFPIQGLKIDRSFVRGIGATGHRENVEIVRTILLLAQNLNIDVIAEGIETEAQQQELLALKCRWGQGYVFAPPLEEEAAERLLAASGRSAEAPGVP